MLGENSPPGQYGPPQAGASNFRSGILFGIELPESSPQPKHLKVPAR